jgi:hypothetical protein
MRPRVPEDSDFGRLIMTVVSAAGVVGGSFRMRGFVGGEELDFEKLFNAGWAFG